MEDDDNADDGDDDLGLSVGLRSQLLHMSLSVETLRAFIEANRCTDYDALYNLEKLVSDKIVQCLLRPSSKLLT